MRVSEQQRFWLTANRIYHAKKESLAALRQLSTQKRINDLHDDPIGMIDLVRIDKNVTELNSFRKNVAFSKGFLDTSEQAISGIRDALGRAQELAIAMSNDTYAADSRGATAEEVKVLTDQIVSLGNSRFGGKYVFSGFRSATPALSLDGNYQGDDGTIFLQTDPETLSAINVSGRDLFSATSDQVAEGHMGLLDSMNILRESLLSNDKTSLYRATEELQYQLDKVTSLQASVGALWNTLEQADSRVDLVDEQLQTSKSNIEQVDIFDASSRFKKAETMLSATLTASNKLLQPTLMDYI